MRFQQLMRHLMGMLMVVIVVVVLAILVGGDLLVDEVMQYLLRVGTGPFPPLDAPDGLPHLVGLGLDPQVLPVTRKRIGRTAVEFVEESPVIEQRGGVDPFLCGVHSLGVRP